MAADHSVIIPQTTAIPFDLTSHHPPIEASKTLVLLLIEVWHLPCTYAIGGSLPAMVHKILFWSGFGAFPPLPKLYVKANSVLL